MIPVNCHLLALLLDGGKPSSWRRGSLEVYGYFDVETVICSLLFIPATFSQETLAQRRFDGPLWRTLGGGWYRARPMRRHRSSNWLDCALPRQAIGPAKVPPRSQKLRSRFWWSHAKPGLSEVLHRLRGNADKCVENSTTL